LDWDDQPSGFRNFIGCELIKLPKTGSERDILFSELAQPRRAENLNQSTLGLLLELSFGLSAWKQYGSERWALRCNPSSGNLHPTEAYLINANSEGLAAGVYHYQPYQHALARRCLFEQPLTSSGVLIALSSVHWREAWKYGERAFRYCQHDIGHALGCLRYAAAVLGWRVELVNQCSDEQLSGLFGVNRVADFKADEREYADVLCRIHTENSASYDLDELIQAAQTAHWQGVAEPLNQRHFYQWQVIDKATQATEKPRTEPLALPALALNRYRSNCQKTATQIIRQRRSAQNFNPKASLAKLDFYQLLAATLPEQLPFDLWSLPTHSHLFIFVHRVDGLEAGLYALPRKTEALAALQSATAKEFEWLAIADAPVNLYRLLSGNCRNAAKTLSCHQAIASDSAFSLAMVSEFAQPLESEPWQYRYLFWEAGLIGQVLYLQAEAVGMRGTGIGCYFDDSVHQVLGLFDERFQSLYHFTVGLPLIDNRLQTLPAYEHLD
jgi:SagB-type dehydrogenase family enzyme